MAAINYAKAGVDREAADRLVDRIAGLSKKTLNRDVVSSVGGYASLYRLGPDQWIAASTDGVGTKLKLAFELGIHDTVGVDLVAMSVNDLLCVGATPLFFLDYFATGKLDRRVAAKVIEGIVQGCREASCALVGGETAELPDFYQPGEYDLAGFAVGALHPRQALPRAREVKPGDVCLGIASTGIHSNGYTLVRRLLDLEGKKPGVRRKLARELLTPTRIYVRALAPLLGKNSVIKGLAHITGSGFLNVPRISDRVSYDLTLPTEKDAPGIYRWIRSRSGLPIEELAQTFNMGVGMVVVADKKDVRAIRRAIEGAGETVFELGAVVKKRSTKSWVRVEDPASGGAARLEY